MHTMSSESDTATRSERNGAIAPLLIAAAIGAAVSVSLGVYGRVHDPTGEQIAHFGFSSTLSMKAWLGTGVAVLAAAQAGTAAWMWGRLPGFGRAPGWAPHLHRWTGTAAFLLSLRRRLRRRLAAPARRRRATPGRTRPGGVLGRAAGRRIESARGGAWPLYRFAGDAVAGDTNGQGSGGVWFVVDPAGGLIKDAG